VAAGSAWLMLGQALGVVQWAGVAIVIGSIAIVQYLTANVAPASSPHPI